MDHGTLRATSRRHDAVVRSTTPCQSVHVLPDGDRRFGYPTDGGISQALSSRPAVRHVASIFTNTQKNLVGLRAPCASPVPFSERAANGERVWRRSPFYSLPLLRCWRPRAGFAPFELERARPCFKLQLHIRVMILKWFKPSQESPRLGASTNFEHFPGS